MALSTVRIHPWFYGQFLRKEKSLAPGWISFQLGSVLKKHVHLLNNVFLITLTCLRIWSLCSTRVNTFPRCGFFHGMDGLTSCCSKFLETCPLVARIPCAKVVQGISVTFDQCDRSRRYIPLRVEFLCEKMYSTISTWSEIHKCPLWMNARWFHFTVCYFLPQGLRYHRRELVA